MKNETKAMKARLLSSMSTVAFAAGVAVLGGGISAAVAQDLSEDDQIAQVATASVAENEDQISGDNKGPIDAITVTATGREQAIEDVPYNISAKGQNELESLGITDFSKLTRSFAGLQLTDRGVRDNTTSARLISRGMNTESSTFADLPFVTVSPVATYIDNTPIFVNLRLNDVQRTEFLRGPQGTLYGSGSMGGTLRFIHNQPDTTDYYGRATAGFSRTEDAGGLNYTVSGMANVPLSDNVALRVSGGHDFYHGFIDATSRAVLGPNDIAEPENPLDPLGSGPATRYITDINDADSTYIHAALRVDLSDSWFAQLNYHSQKDNADNRDAQSAVAGVPKRTTSTLLNEPLTRELDLVSLDVEGDFGFATLTSNTSYFETSTEAVSDLTGYYDYIGYLLAPRVTSPLNAGSSNETFVQEFRLVSQSDGQVEWLAGVYYMDEEQVALHEEDYLRGDSLVGNTLTSSDDLFLILHRDTKFEDLALYGEITYWFSDLWQVTGGIRLFQQKFDSYSYFDFPAFGFYPGDPNSFEEDGVLFKVNTSYEATDYATLYATFSQGFRRGGANSVPTSGPLAEPAGLLSYDSDRVNNYEVGVKGIFENGIQYSAALYYMDWSDAQIGTLSPVFGYDVAVNGGDATTSGFELELSGSLTENLDFSFGYAYTDASLDDGFSGYVTGQAGASLPGVSEHTLNGSLDYSHQMQSGAEFIAHIDASYRSDFANGVDNTADIFREFDGFTIVAAAVGLQTEGWQATLFVENIFDEDGFSAQNDPVISGTQGYVEWVTRPRTIGVRLAADF